MADPVVHITNGIPDLGTGNITTLGQTLVDGANVALGSTADLAVGAGAAGTINAHLRAISRDLVNGIVLQPSSNLIGNVGQSGAPWSQNVTQFGSAAVATGTGIGGPGIPRVTVSSDSSLAATQSGTWNINNISGTVALPTGAAVSSKQPALGTSGVPSADVLTVQGISGGTALKVDGTGGTFPVSGTIAATQSGTWNINNISGAVTLPTGAATAAKQPSPSTAGSPSADVLTVQGASGMTALKINLFGNAGAVLDFAGQNASGTVSAQLAGGQFNTTPTTIVSGNFSPLQLDSAGNLLVNVKAGGASGGTSSTFGSAFPGTGTAVGAKDSAGVNMQPLNLDASGNLKVNVAAGGASGGTSSSFGSAIPATGTAAGFSDGTNMQLGHVWDGDSGAGTQWVQGVLLKTPASGGAVDIGVSGQPLRVDPTGTTTQPVSGTVTVTQGTAANLNATVSGTVTANQGGTWNITNISGTVSLPTGAATSANQPTAGALGSTTSGQTGTLSLGAVTTAAPTYVTAQSNALSLTTAGALRIDGSGSTQPVSGTITANQGGTWNITNISGTVSLPTGAATAANQCTAAASATTTAGQTGHLAMGATTTGAPAYTTGQTNPLSLTTSGALRVDGSGVTQPVSGTFWQATQPVSIAATVNVSAAQSGNWTSRIVGNTGVVLDAAQNAAAPANELVVGGVYNSTAPTLTSGNASQLQLDASGNLNVNIKAGAGSGGTASSFGATFPATGTAAGAEYLSTPPTLTSGQMVALQVTSAGSLHTTVDNTVAVTGTFWQTTQPVSGTVTVQQASAANLNATVSGTVTVSSISSTVTVTGAGGTFPITAASLPLPTGAATAANQPTAATAGSTTSGQIGNIAMGAVTTGAPTYTTAQSNFLSLTTAGALRTDASATTQPVSGTVTVSQGTAANLNATVTGTVNAAQSGTWTVQPGNTVNTTPWLVTPKGFQDSGGTDITDTVNHALKVNIVAGAGSGGTASTFGATFPTQGTAAGAEYLSSPPALTSGQMVALQVTSAGSLHTTVDNTVPVTGTFWQSTQPVSGTFWQATQPVSIAATVNVSAAQSGTWTVQPGNTANTTAWLVTGAGGTFPVTGTFWQATQPVSIAAAVTVAQATAANLNATVTGTVNAAQSGAWNVTNITGTVSLPTGAATAANQLLPAIYNAGTAWTSATAVNTVAALVASTGTSYTTIIGQITQTSTITGGVITFEESYDNGATYVTIPGQRIVDPTTYAGLQNPYTCVPSTNQRFHIIPSSTGQIRARLSTVIAGTGSVTVQWTLSPVTAVDLTNTICAGDTVAGGTDQGWPVKIGGVSKTTQPTAWTDGQRTAATFDKQGKLIVNGAIRQLKGVQKTSISVSTETTVVTAGAAGVFQDVYAIVVTNKSATAVFVDFRDATAGTVRMTLSAPAGDTRGFTVPVDSAMVQAAAANAWTATVSAAVASIEITMLFVSNL